MIKVQNELPDIYYKESRDFQLLGRVYEALLNYAKTNASLVGTSALTEDVDADLLQLLATSLGFISKHKYSNRNLRELCSVFSYILKHKGSIQSIEDAVRVLLHAQNIAQTPEVKKSTLFENHVDIYLPIELQHVEDVILLEDILDYILPAGTTYKFIYALKLDNDIHTKLKISDNQAISYTLEQEHASKIFTEDSELDPLKPSEETDKVERGTFFTNRVYSPEISNGTSSGGNTNG